MEQTIIFNKERSIKASAADGWRMVALGWKRYLAALWPQLLILAAAAAFLLEMTVQYVCDHALPAYLLADMGAQPEVVRAVALPSIPLGTYWTLALLIFVFAGACFLARVYSVMQVYRLTNAMPSTMPLQMNRGEFEATRRIVLIAILAFLVFNLISLPVIYAALKWNPWIALVLVIIGSYLWASANLATLQYALFGKTLKASLVYGLKHGFGTSGILQFITLLPTLFGACVFLAPAVLYVCTEVAGTNSTLMSDPSGLPSYLPFLFFVINTVCFSLYKYFASLRTWTLALKTV